MITMTMAKADLGRVPVFAMGGALVGSILMMTALLVALRPFLARGFTMSGPSFTSVFQGATRWNSFVAIATAGALYGELGLTLTAISIAAMIPLLNVLAVVMLQVHAQGKPVVLGPTLKALIANPFIWSSALGVAINLSGLPLPTIVARFGDILGSAALATGLVLVGAGLDTRAALKPRTLTWIATGLKLVLMPLFAVALALLFGIDGVPLKVAVLSAAMPTASGAYIIARQMGGDAPLMAEILTVQTLIATVTIPVVLGLLE
jgi:predicted permease